MLENKVCNAQCNAQCMSKYICKALKVLHVPSCIGQEEEEEAQLPWTGAKLGDPALHADVSSQNNSKPRTNGCCVTP